MADIVQASTPDEDHEDESGDDDDDDGFSDTADV